MENENKEVNISIDKNSVKYGYNVSKAQWKEIFMKIKTDFHITRFAKTNKEGDFLDYCYLLFEAKNHYFYINNASVFESFNGISVCCYLKVSPYEQRQCEFPVVVHSYKELVDYVSHFHPTTPLSGVYKQRIFDLYKIGKDGRTILSRLTNVIAGYREREVLNHLERIEMTQYDEDVEVLQFVSVGGDTFEFELNGERITD